MEKYIEELLEKVLKKESKPQILDIYKKIKIIDLSLEKEIGDFIDQNITLEE